MSSLILMRHGQASFGANVYDQLSPIGLEQARISGNWIKDRPPLFAIWHGPRERHINTAKEMLALSPEYLSKLQGSYHLDEFSEGEELLAAASLHFEGEILSSLDSSNNSQLHYYEKTIAEWSNGNLAIPGRSDYSSFRKNIAQWLDSRINDQGAPSGRVELAVTSAGVICAAVCDALNLPNHQWLSLMKVIKNASFTEFVFSNGRCSLRSFNETGHLPPEIFSSI